jgi:hypothetical protein
MARTRKASAPKITEARTAGNSPDRAEIALRAYHIYLERGGAPGDELDDWTRAERELLASNGKPSRKPKSKPIAA